MRLQFDFFPQSVTVGEPFTVAVIVADEIGSPAAGCDDLTHTVTLRSADPSVTLCADPVPLSYGEALFDGVRVTCVDGGGCPSGFFAIVAEAVDFDPCESDAIALEGIPSAGAGVEATQAERDEDLMDIGELQQRLQRAKGARVKHYLMLIKGRIWAREENATKIAACGLGATLIETLRGCDADEAIEVIGVVQELLTNPTGAPLLSCASCRSTIRQEDVETGRVVRTVEGRIVFHTSCLTCSGCGQGLGVDVPFVRDAQLKPWHAACSQKAGLAAESLLPPTVCELVENRSADVVGSAAGEGQIALAVEHFLESDLRGFVEALATHHIDDDYVRQRLQRLVARLSPRVRERAAALVALVVE